jgi:hypothetical protein
MKRRSFLKAAVFGALYDRRAQTRHVILIVNGGGARKKDYYEDASLAPNVRRIAAEGFVFEEDHCDTVSSHDSAFTEMVHGLDCKILDSMRLIPATMRNARPKILVRRELTHDVGHEDYRKYVGAIRKTDRQIGAVFDWIKRDDYFSRNTTLIIRPDFGRDDEVNQFGQLHHSFGYYYTHRVARIIWGRDFRWGMDQTTILNRSDMASMLDKLAAAT